jgi:colicin import membrane protein
MSEDKKEENNKTPETKAEITEISETETKVDPTETKGEDDTSKPEKKSSKPGMTASELAAIAEAEALAASARSKAAKEAAEKALDEEYKAAAKEAVVAKVSDSFTNKRFKEQIFRREMGEPEFFLHKHELAPPRHILTPEEQDEISRRVEIPTDQTPEYNPQHMLSPEYHGTSNYESGIETLRDELEEKLAKLQKDPNASRQELYQAEEDLKTVDYLFENYNLGMNVFRTAKGGRNKFDK